MVAIGAVSTGPGAGTGRTGYAAANSAAAASAVAEFSDAGLSETGLSETGSAVPASATGVLGVVIMLLRLGPTNCLSGVSCPW